MTQAKTPLALVSYEIQVLKNYLIFKNNSELDETIEEMFFKNVHIVHF